LIKVIHKLQDGCIDLPTVHFTSGQAITLWDLSELAKSFSLIQVKYIEVTPRTFDISSFVGNTELANLVLNWQAKVPLQDGIGELIDQYRQESDFNKAYN
jgi:nucleoside-diphosphate-sugar epimerase